MLQALFNVILKPTKLKKKKSENNSDYKDYQNSKLAFQKNFLTFFLIPCQIPSSAIPHYVPIAGPCLKALGEVGFWHLYSHIFQ